MDYDSYRRRFFVDPPPEQRFPGVGLHGAVLYFADYAAAVDFYGRVLGPPAYVEGEGTRGWRVGSTWLTLLQGERGGPGNVEVTFVAETPAEAERLHTAFLEAGAIGEPPTDQLMYEPVRSCPVRDPFGTQLLIVAPLRKRGS